MASAQILQKLNLKPEEAMMVGDRISRDINVAKKLIIQMETATFVRV